MNRYSPRPLLIIVLVAATLRVSWVAEGPAAQVPPPAVSSSASGAGPSATPTLEVLIGQAPAWRPLPEGCSPERVVGIVIEFIDAFNHGDEARLAALFRPDVIDADGTPDPSDTWRNPGWFAVRGDPWVDARNDDEMLVWVVGRHAQGERWTLLQLFMGGYWWRGGVDISFDFRREAYDLPAKVVGGKGAIDCDDGTVFLWNVGEHELLAGDLFDPRATPVVGGASPTPSS